MLFNESLEKKNALGLSRSQWEVFFKDHGEKPFRAQQILQWIHQRFVGSFEEMTNLSKSIRSLLEQNFFFPIMEVVSSQLSVDGTRKWLIRTETLKSSIEVVYIPEETRKTLCISSQVGCELNCQFCYTATQGFERNLSSSEIIGQVWFVQKILKEEYLERSSEKAITSFKYGISNVVFMGMGEPLRNLQPVLDSLSLLTDDFAYGLSKRRVTVSTSGVIPGIEELAKHVDVALALSLHAPNNNLRDILMPINKKYPIEDLLPAVAKYLDTADRQMHVTIEYVMLEGVNDQILHAQQLAKLVGRYVSGRAKINLIPFNSFPTAKYTCSSPETIRDFSEVLRQKNIITTIRKTRGPDILGACGQLAGDVQDKTRRRQKYLQEVSQSMGYLTQQTAQG